MAYEIESWTRSPGAKGEERHRVWRIRNIMSGVDAMALALQDRGICRITLARTGSETIWDLWRSEGRDQELDASMRDLKNLRATDDRPTIDVGPGVTQEQLADAIAALVSMPSELDGPIQRDFMKRSGL